MKKEERTRLANIAEELTEDANAIEEIQAETENVALANVEHSLLKLVAKIKKMMVAS